MGEPSTTRRSTSTSAASPSSASLKTVSRCSRLHGHIHESPRLTGKWRQQIGRTHAFTAAHDGPELALVRFDLDDLDNATRELLRGTESRVKSEE